MNQRIILSRSEDIIFLEHEVMEYPKTRNVLLYETKSHKNGIVTEEENDYWLTGKIERSIVWSLLINGAWGKEEQQGSWKLSTVIIIVNMIICYHYWLNIN